MKIFSNCVLHYSKALLQIGWTAPYICFFPSFWFSVVHFVLVIYENMKYLVKLNCYALVYHFFYFRNNLKESKDREEVIWTFLKKCRLLFWITKLSFPIYINYIFKTYGCSLFSVNRKVNERIMLNNRTVMNSWSTKNQHSKWNRNIPIMVNNLLFYVCLENYVS